MAEPPSPVVEEAGSVAEPPSPRPRLPRRPRVRAAAAAPPVLPVDPPARHRGPAASAAASPVPVVLSKPDTDGPDEDVLAELTDEADAEADAIDVPARDGAPTPTKVPRRRKSNENVGIESTVRQGPSSYDPMVARYFRDVGRYPLLGKEEELEAGGGKWRA